MLVNLKLFLPIIMFLFSEKKIINNLSRKAHTRVLVSPLDWGLGHATRCIPIIIALSSFNCEVFIAAEGATCALLKSEFTNLNFLPLSGYKIRFSRNKSFFSGRYLASSLRLYTLFVMKGDG